MPRLSRRVGDPETAVSYGSIGYENPHSYLNACKTLPLMENGSVVLINILGEGIWRRRIHELEFSKPLKPSNLENPWLAWKFSIFSLAST